MESNNNGSKHHIQHPLPKEIQEMKRDETVCQYCGVSYLIHREIKELETRLEEANAEIQNLKEYAEKYKRLDQKWKITEQESILLEKENANLKLLTQQQETALSQLDQEKRRILSDYEHLKSVSADSENQREALKNRLQELFGTVEFMQNQVKVHRNEVVQLRMSLVTQMQNFKLSSDSINQLLNELRIMHSQEIKQHVDEMESLKSTNTRLTGQLTSLEGQHNEISHSKDQLASTIEKLGQEKDDALKKLTDAQSKLKQTAMESEQYAMQLKTKSEEIHTLNVQGTHKVKHLIDEAASLRTTVHNLQGEITQHKREQQKLQESLRQQVKLREELSVSALSSTYDRDSMQSQLDEAQSTLDALKLEREQMITAHQCRIEQLKESYRQKMANSSEWQRKMDAAVAQEKSRHTEELQSLTNAFDHNLAMELQIEKEKQEELRNALLADKLKEIDKLWAENEKLRLSTVESSQLKQKMVLQRKETQATEGRLKQEVQSLKSSISMLEDKLGNLDDGNYDVINKLEQELSQKDQVISEIKAKELSLQASIDRHTEEARVMQETVRRECEERFELTQALGDAKEEIMSLRRRPSNHAPGGPVHQRLTSPSNQPAASLSKPKYGEKQETNPPPVQAHRRPSISESAQSQRSSSSVSISFDNGLSRNSKKKMEEHRRRIAIAMGKVNGS